MYVEPQQYSDISPLIEGFLETLSEEYPNLDPYNAYDEGDDPDSTGIPYTVFRAFCDNSSLDLWGEYNDPDCLDYLVTGEGSVDPNSGVIVSVCTGIKQKFNDTFHSLDNPYTTALLELFLKDVINEGVSDEEFLGIVKNGGGIQLTNVIISSAEITEYTEEHLLGSMRILRRNYPGFPIELLIHYTYYYSGRVVCTVETIYRK